MNFWLFTLRRLAYTVVTLFLIVTFTFFLMHLLPGSPLKDEEKLPPQTREIILQQYGLDQPLYSQYLRFLGKLFQGDLGNSYYFDGRPVVSMIKESFPASAQLGGQALIVGVSVGISLGLVAGLKRGSLVDNLVIFIAVIGVSFPGFVVAAFLSYYVGVKLAWLPPGLWEGFQYSILPTLALSLMVIAMTARFVRTEMIEVLEADYIRTAKAKGVSQLGILSRHVLRNTLIPVITILGPLTVNLMTGSLVVEKIFAIPGMGELFVKSIETKDLTLIMGLTIFYASFLIVTLFIIDIIYGWVDPRIRVSQEKKG